MSYPNYDYSLEQIADEVYEWCVEKGWEPDLNRTFGDEVALLHSECSEMLEAFRDRGFDSWDDPDGKPQGVASEMADLLIRLSHYARVHDIDLQAEFNRKMTYNRKRPIRHGGKRL